MTTFLCLPVEVREMILNKLPNGTLLQCRQVCKSLLDLANHLLHRRHQQVWAWKPHFLFSDEDDWVHSKMDKGVVAGGLPACCRRHNFERTNFSQLLTRSLVIWIEDQAMSAKLNKVVKPLIQNHGALLTSFTLTLEECSPMSIRMCDITGLFALTPNLRHFGFKVCNCSIRPLGPYQTRLSAFPALPHLEVLDLEYNESVIFTDALLQAYGNQLKRLIISSTLLVNSNFLSNAIMKYQQQGQSGVSAPMSTTSVFSQLRDLKIGGISGIYLPRTSFDTYRRKYAGKTLFAKMAALPSWPLERLSLNIDDWALHRSDRWGVATPELLQMMANFSGSLKELYVSIEYVDRSLDLSDWHSDQSKNGTSPPKCPQLKTVFMDSVLMETPLLSHILQGFGHVENLYFTMWSRYDSRWSTRYALADIPGNPMPSELDLPQMVAKLWRELPSLGKISVLGQKSLPALYESTRQM